MARTFRKPLQENYFIKRLLDFQQLTTNINLKELLDSLTIFGEIELCRELLANEIRADRVRFHLQLKDSKQFENYVNQVAHGFLHKFTEVYDNYHIALREAEELANRNVKIDRQGCITRPSDIVYLLEESSFTGGIIEDWQASAKINQLKDKYNKYLDLFVKGELVHDNCSPISFNRQITQSVVLLLKGAISAGSTSNVTVEYGYDTDAPKDSKTIPGYFLFESFFTLEKFKFLTIDYFGNKLVANASRLFSQAAVDSETKFDIGEAAIKISNLITSGIANEQLLAMRPVSIIGKLGEWILYADGMLCEGSKEVATFDVNSDPYKLIAHVFANQKLLSKDSFVNLLDVFPDADKETSLKRTQEYINEIAKNYSYRLSRTGNKIGLIPK